MQGAPPPAPRALNRLRHWQNLPNKFPAGEGKLTVQRITDKKAFPLSSAGSQGEGGPGERNFGV